MSTLQNSTLVPTTPEVEFFSHNGRSIFILTHGEVFACGDNEHGQLGLGDHNNRAKPERVKLEAKVRKIITTRNSTFFITEDDQVFSCGWNFEGQLGFGSKKGYITIPQKVAIEKKVREVVSDFTSTFFITEESKVFVCGINYLNKFRFNIDENFLFITTPQEVVFEAKTKEIVARDGSIFFITEDNRIFACGNNMYGQLGISSQIKDIIKPYVIELQATVKKIINYSGSTFFITVDGKVFACGWNFRSQLETGSKEKYIVKPMAALLGEVKVKDVIFNGDFTLFITENNGACICGMRYR